VSESIVCYVLVELRIGYDIGYATVLYCEILDVMHSTVNSFLFVLQGYCQSLKVLESVSEGP